MKRSVLLIIALFVASLNLRPAINSVSPLLETISNTLNMNASVASLLTSIPVLCMGVFAPTAVRLGNKWGIDKVIGYSLFIIGVGTVLRYFAQSSFVLLLTALIAGIGIAMMTPLLSGFIKEHFPNHVPSMISVYTVALTIGAAISSQISPSLKNSFNSWQASLAFWAILAFIAFVIWFLFVNLQNKKGDQATKSTIKPKIPWNNGKAWILTLTFGLVSMLFYSFTAWIPQIIQGLGGSKSSATTGLTLFVVVQIPVSLIFPILLKRLPSKRFWAIVEAVIELIGMILLLAHVNPLLAATLIGLGAGGLFPLVLLYPIDATDNAQDSASWAAMTQSVGYIIGALGPIMLGWIFDLTNSFASAIIVLILINLTMIVFHILSTSAKKSKGTSLIKTAD